MQGNITDLRKMFGYDGYAHNFVSGNGFSVACICQNSPKCVL